MSKKRIRIVENGKERLKTDQSCKKVKLDKKVNSSEMEKIILDSENKKRRK